MLQPGQHIHIVGVGGFGMSAIARVLLQRGAVVSGSDQRANDFTRELTALGATIFEGHAADHIAGADLVIATSAATDANPEIVAARAAGIPVLRRQNILGELMANQIGIAIAGTHGKTTTTALLTHVLIEADLAPTYIVGGVMHNTGTNAGVGAGPHFVIEADEYDRMFLGLRPQIAVITGIEHDHPDCYPTLDEMVAAFEQFAALLPDDGLLVVCADDPQARQLGSLRDQRGNPTTVYGLTDAVRTGWRADHLESDAAGGMTFTVYRSEREIGRARLNLAGQHNVQNALAAIAVADHLGVAFGRIAAALDRFLGTGRRGEIMGQANGVTIVNDYAHHPTAIRVTLAGFRSPTGAAGLWAVWQPHTYGRLRALADGFARAFRNADHVLVTDVYSVREAITPGLDAAGIADRIRATGHPDVRYTGSLEKTTANLVARVRPGDWVILLSAGDLPLIGARILRKLTM
jgi:UDP-N-acetylmuramate--alanine ligase